MIFNLIILVLTLSSNEYSYNMDSPANKLKAIQNTYEKLELLYCDGAEIKTNSSVSEGGPLDWMFRTLYTQPEQLNSDLLGKYTSPSAIIFGIFAFVTIFAWVMCLSVLLSSKLLICCVTVRNKATLKGSEKLLEALMLLMCTALSITAFIYSVKSQKLGNASKCQTYHTIDISIVGDAGFTGFHTFNEDLVNLLQSQSNLMKEKQSSSDCAISLADRTTKSHSSIESYSDTSPDSLLVTDPANAQNKVTPEYLSHLAPIGEPGTIANKMSTQYSNVFDKTSNDAMKLNSSYVEIDFKTTINQIASLRDIVNSTDLYEIVKANEGTDVYKDFNSQVYSINLNLILQSAILLGLMGGMIILHALSMIFPLKCIGILQLNIMFVLILGCFFICAKTFIVGANTGQTCSILNEAIHNNDTDQSIVIQWATNNESQTYELCKSCLFGGTQSPANYLYGFNITAINAMVSNIIASANDYKASYSDNKFNNETVLKIHSDLEYYQDDPLTQTNNAKAKLNELNALTNVAGDNCKINDLWVFNERDCTPDYPILKDNIQIPENACLIFLLVDETKFNARYQQYAATCDPESKIKGLYTPLYSYALTSKNVFGQMALTYKDGFLFNWGNTKIALQAFNEFADAITGFSEYTKAVMENYTNPKYDNRTDCTGIKNSIANLKMFTCKWSASLSLYCLLLWIFAIIGIIYAFLRVNYIRHMNYKNENKGEDKFVKFLPNDQKQDKPTEVKI